MLNTLHVIPSQGCKAGFVFHWISVRKTASGHYLTLLRLLHRNMLSSAETIETLYGSKPEKKFLFNKHDEHTLSDEPRLEAADMLSASFQCEF